MAAAQKVLFRNRTVLVFCLAFYALLKFFLVVRRHHVEEQIELGNIPPDYEELKSYRKNEAKNEKSDAAPVNWPDPDSYKFKDFSDDSCGSMLAKGHWDNFEMKKTADYSLRLPSGEWAYSGQFVPETCDMHEYTSAEIDFCILQQPGKRTVHIIGDSRARLIYRVLSARLHGHDNVEDVKVHDNMANFPFMYYWSQSFNGKPISSEKHEMTSFKRLFMEAGTAQLVIIDEHFLHPSCDYLAYAGNRSMDTLKTYFKESIIHLDETVLPKLAAKTGVTVVVMASEGSKRSFPGWQQKKWDDLTSFYNNEVHQVVDKYDNVYWMDNNAKTGYSPTNKPLLPDGTHKIIKGGVQKIPPSLIADTNFILNLHCNQLIQEKLTPSTCCKDHSKN